MKHSTRTVTQSVTTTVEMIREYGPFAGVNHVHGVTYDGQNVWFAAGGTLNAFDPASGKTLRIDRCPRGGRNCLRGAVPISAHRGSHPED